MTSTQKPNLFHLARTAPEEVPKLLAEGNELEALRRAILFRSLVYQALRDRQEAAQLLHGIVTAMLDGTDWYKTDSKELQPIYDHTEAIQAEIAQWWVERTTKAPS